MSQINSGESLDTADEYSASERDRKHAEPERRLTLKERQARRSGMYFNKCFYRTLLRIKMFIYFLLELAVFGAESQKMVIA